MTDDKRPNDPNSPADDSESEEFARSDRTPQEVRATQPVPPAAAEPPEPAFATVDETEDVSKAAPEVAEPPTGGDAAADVETSSEDGTTPDAAPEAPTVIREETGKPKRTTSLLVPILAASTAVFFIAAVLLGLMAFAPRIAPIKSGPTKLAARAQEEDGIKQVASRFAENFVSLDYKTIDKDLDQMAADATNSFATKLRETVERIAPAFKERKASSTGTALDAAILSHTDDSAIVQVLLRRTKTNVGTKGPETGNQIVNVTLVQTDDGWKVSDLSQLGAEGG